MAGLKYIDQNISSFRP